MLTRIKAGRLVLTGALAAPFDAPGRQSLLTPRPARGAAAAFSVPPIRGDGLVAHRLRRLICLRSLFDEALNRFGLLTQIGADRD